MPFKILRQDIAKMDVDAIVNAANSKLKQGGGVCGAIFEGAGAGDMRAACEAIGYCKPGEAVMTPGFGLPARHVIHTVGPVWQGGDNNEEAVLRACYQNSLTLAKENGLHSIAFPLISSGIYGYPKDRALEVALGAIGGFLMEHETPDYELRAYLVVFDRRSFQLSDTLFRSISSFVDDNYAERYSRSRRRSQWEREEQLLEYSITEEVLPSPAIFESIVFPSLHLDEHLNSADEETFTAMLLRLIDEKGISDPQAYKQSNISRKVFSKIQSNPKHQPSKKTALAFAIGLGLSVEQTRDLLMRAGYALSPSNPFDLVVQWFIANQRYDIYEVDAALFKFTGQTLT